MLNVLKKAGSIGFVVFAMPVLTIVSISVAAGEEALKCGETTIKAIKEIVNS